MQDPAEEYSALLAAIEREGGDAHRHLVAFSGGVDSTLVAKAVFDVFPENSEAVMALSPSVADVMRQSAVDLAARIGIPLRFIETHEYLDPDYVANEGLSCYVCKRGIYDTMEAIAASDPSVAAGTLLYNGTNAEDAADPTRVGLRAAREHAVRSPLARYCKDEIRQLLRFAGLPNWNAAASPCLRSRLQIGVEATPEHLRRIEAAEDIVRQVFDLDGTVDFRVRHLAGDTAMVEIGEALLHRIDLAHCGDALRALGFRAVDKRPFRSGSVSRGDVASADTAASADADIGSGDSATAGSRPDDGDADGQS